MSKHTKGPWTNNGIYVVSKSGTPILPIETEEFGKIRNGDARLIAAAPELLEACKQALEVAPYGPRRELLINAIAKAEGEEI